LLAALALLTLLTACQRAPTRAPAPAAPAVPAADLSGATIFEVNRERSLIDILVYRGGAMARLGHNHAISSRDVRGRAWIHPAFARSGFEITLPVGELVVDEPEARRRAGEEFAREVPEADREGTRRNMLRPEVLDAERYPEIGLRSLQLTGSLQAPELTVRITIRGVSRDMNVPVKIGISGAELTAEGEFDILQTDFGIEPFMVALGLIEVMDRLHIRFRIVALSSS
jgi:hypothetical protein